MSGAYGTFSTAAEESRQRAVSDRVLIARLYNYAKPFRRNLAIAVTAILLSSVTGLLSPYLHKVAIDQIIAPKDLSGFIWWLPIFISVTLGNYVLQHIQIFQMRIVGERLVAKMRG
ncbi:MAG: hypothetical protein ACUVUE_01575, partial [Candidatus Bathycorpusculaceae bacterium]